MVSSHTVCQDRNTTRRELPAPPGYRLLELLGRGAFGEVWKAEGPGAFFVALKYVPLRDGVANSEIRSLVYLKRIRHPNLLTPFATWQLDGYLVIGMDLADGSLQDLLSEVQNRGLTGIPRDELHRYMSQSAEGIDHLNGHRHDFGNGIRAGVQHRDVKPLNILLFGSGIKVADFGISRLLEHSAANQTGGMTVAYAAPEFFARKASDRSDQYSLAVTYCELRGGRRPFVGSPLQLMYAHMNAPPDLGMLPPEEQAIVGRALAKKPNDRWPDCRTFVTELQASWMGYATASILTRVPPASTNVSVVDNPGTSLPGRSGREAPPESIPCATGVIRVRTNHSERAERSVVQSHGVSAGSDLEELESQMSQEHRIHQGSKQVKRWVVTIIGFAFCVILPSWACSPNSLKADGDNSTRGNGNINMRAYGFGCASNTVNR